MRANRVACRAWRERCGLTVTQAAADSEISPQYLCDIEAGRRPGTPPVIKRLAHTYKVDIGALIENPSAADLVESSR